MLYISGINYESIADAEGVCCTIFISGCRHQCPGCHSEGTWDFKYGKCVDNDLINEINRQIDKRPFLNGIVLSGGDPMYSAREVCKMLDKLHIPNENIWCYSGFTIEEIKLNKHMNMLLNRCSVLVDGPFEIENRDVTLNFRGSKNQRILKLNPDGSYVDITKWEGRS